MSMRYTVFDCFSIQSFDPKMTEQHPDPYKKIFQGTEERKSFANPVDSDEEIKLPEGI
jgi:hypothetical protein